MVQHIRHIIPGIVCFMVLTFTSCHRQSQADVTTGLSDSIEIDNSDTATPDSNQKNDTINNKIPNSSSPTYNNRTTGTTEHPEQGELTAPDSYSKDGNIELYGFDDDVDDDNDMDGYMNDY